MKAAAELYALECLSEAGFVQRASADRNIHLLGNDKVISPAFYCTFQKRRGEIRFYGGVGPYFHEFEEHWAGFSRSSKQQNKTLPLIITTDNFLELSGFGVFSFTSDRSLLLRSASGLVKLCSDLPGSVSEFVACLCRGSMLDRPISDYLHIQPYQDVDNPYVKKSLGFLRWFIEKWPERASELISSLSLYQRNQLRTPGT